jgi:hypothetical protein
MFSIIAVLPLVWINILLWETFFELFPLSVYTLRNSIFNIPIAFYIHHLSWDLGNWYLDPLFYIDTLTHICECVCVCVSMSVCFLPFEHQKNLRYVKYSRRKKNIRKLFNEQVVESVFSSPLKHVFWLEQRLSALKLVLKFHCLWWSWEGEPLRND